MANVFDQLITKGVRAGQLPARTSEAREWYRGAAGEFKRVNERKLISSDQTRLTSKILPGSMYMYYYDPKWKEELPFYDRFPLVFPFKVESDRFWGLNMHYLPLPLRARLMDALYDLANNSRYDENTRLRMSYALLDRSAKFKWFQPCVKQYLFSHVQTRFMYVYPSEWDIALFLPTERFVKASKTQVWADSKSIINGTR
jgi:hypothetical protein